MATREGRDQEALVAASKINIQMSAEEKQLKGRAFKNSF